MLVRQDRINLGRANLLLVLSCTGSKQVITCFSWIELVSCSFDHPIECSSEPRACQVLWMTTTSSDACFWLAMMILCRAELRALAAIGDTHHGGTFRSSNFAFWLSTVTVGFCNVAVIFNKDGLQECCCLARGQCFRSIPWRNSGSRVLGQEVLHCRGAHHVGADSWSQNPRCARAACTSDKDFGHSGHPGECRQIRVDCAGWPLMPEKRPPSIIDAVHFWFWLSCMRTPPIWWWGMLPIMTIDKNRKSEGEAPCSFQKPLQQFVR